MCCGVMLLILIIYLNIQKNMYNKIYCECLGVKNTCQTTIIILDMNNHREKVNTYAFLLVTVMTVIAEHIAHILLIKVLSCIAI